MLHLLLALENCFSCAFSQNSKTKNTVINLNQICESNSSAQIQVLHENVPVFTESFQQQKITIQTPLQENLLIIASLDGKDYEFHMKTLKNGLNTVLISVSITITVLIVISVLVVLKMIQKYKRKQAKKQATPANSTNVTMIADESSVCTCKRIDSVIDQYY
ncbi:Hypothetical_protein [Hexamita inflata]|uniref:Hypothetical_protein n=1 Tax=Hexamita inflata TaxID=28002 RepID=A0AA86S5D6_9EUKA|nr:Hypothetical protein HINF_LOCUS65980 [Hexamita inflata]